MFRIYFQEQVLSKGYAIVGQGSIKNIIEARPEELRFFVEEAAGYQSIEHAGERRKVASEIVRQTFYGLMILFKNWTNKLKLTAQAESAAKYQEKVRKNLR